MVSYMASSSVVTQLTVCMNLSWFVSYLEKQFTLPFSPCTVCNNPLQYPACEQRPFDFLS